MSARPALIEKTRAAMRAEAAEATAERPERPGRPRAQQAAARPRDAGCTAANGSRRPALRTAAASQPRRRRRWPVAAAACLAAALSVFGLAAAVGTRETPISGAFAVKAYAETTASPVASSDERIVFPIDRRTGLQGGADLSGELFSGILFTVEGEGISRIQATLSRGEIYSYESEVLPASGGDEAKRREALAWKPAAVGTGDYYKKYDKLVLLPGEEDESGRRAIEVRMLKRLGSTIDVPLAEGEPRCWGMWLDVDADDRGNANLEAMDGQTLTVTAQFANGAYETQVIELHAGWFATERADDADGIVDALPTGEPLSESERAYESESEAQKPPSERKYLHTLYGTLVKTTDEPHPYPLDDANEYADAAAPTENGIENYLDAHGTTETLPGVPQAGRMHEASDVVTAPALDHETEPPTPRTFELSNFSAYATSALPAKIDLMTHTEVSSFSGNIEYMNKCRTITNGWSVDSQGTVNDGNSFVVVEFDMTNPSDEEATFHSSGMGTICAIDEEANETVFALGGLFGITDGTARDESGMYRYIHFAPGETRRITAAFIADDRVAASDDAALLTSGRIGTEGAAGDRRDDVGQMEFVRLGKLERR